MPNFDDYNALDALAKRMQQDIESYTIAKYPAEFRDHLGASEIGNDCGRALYFAFRHVRLVEHKGRMRRLFQRGHTEEANFIDLLRGIGLTIKEVESDGNQARIIGIMDHFGGSLDGQALLPERYGFPPNEVLLCEFKTHNTKSFTHLVDKRVMIAKPRHWAQMCSYAYKRSIRYGIYCAVNKNDDDLYIEVLKMDWNLGKDCERKAEEIVMARRPPPRLAQTEDYYVCKTCDFKDICFNAAPLRKNCRSCEFSLPVENGAWHCMKFNGIIPPDFIDKGCDAYTELSR